MKNIIIDFPSVILCYFVFTTEATLHPVECLDTLLVRLYVLSFLLLLFSSSSTSRILACTELLLTVCHNLYSENHPDSHIKTIQLIFIIIFKKNTLGFYVRSTFRVKVVISVFLLESVTFKDF